MQEINPNTFSPALPEELTSMLKQSASFSISNCTDCIFHQASPFHADLLLYCHLLVGHRLLNGHYTSIISPDYLSFRLVVSGSEYVRYDNKIYLAEAGDLMIFLPYHNFRYASKQNDPCVIRSIAVKGSLLDELIKHTNLNSHCFLHLKEPECFLEYFDRFQNLLSNKSASDPTLNAAITFRFLQKILLLAEHRHIPEMLQNILHYIDSNIGEDLSLPTLSRVFRCSSVSINQLFRRHLDCSTHAYIMKCRMERSRGMMLHQGYSIKETAAALGFKFPFNFSTQFRKYYGYSPREYLQGKTSS